MGFPGGFTHQMICVTIAAMKHIIEGKKCVLRIAGLSDAPEILRMRNSDPVRRRFLYQKTITPKLHERWYHENVETGKALQYLILEKETEAPLGVAYFSHIDRENRQAEWGIYLGEERAFGKGIPREAFFLLAPRFMEEYGLHKLKMRALGDNERSIRCHRALGFREEGLFHDEVLLDGVYHDVFFGYMLKEELLNMEGVQSDG